MAVTAVAFVSEWRARSDGADDGVGDGADGAL